MTTAAMTTHLATLFVTTHDDVRGATVAYTGVAVAVGLEPPTTGLTIRLSTCSTD
jgi:hypothetical protein